MTASNWWDRTELDHVLGAAVVSGRPIRGGDVADAWRLELGDGRSVFAKTHADPPPGMFTTEGGDLEWLGEPEALPVPGVLAASDADPAHLVLEWVDEGGAPDEVAFGRGLAALHDAGAGAYGRLDGKPTGTLSVPNGPYDDRPTFFAEGRLRPLAEAGRDRRALDEDLAAALEALADRASALDVPEEPPARTHGDLWAGNRIVGRDGRSWLIDPQAHGGHREADLAYMALFGGFGDDCWRGYEEVHPLPTGWQDRVALHQIPILTVHVIHFGSGYVGPTWRAVQRYL